MGIKGKVRLKDSWRIRRELIRYLSVSRGKESYLMYNCVLFLGLRLKSMLFLNKEKVRCMDRVYLELISQV